MAKTKFIKVGDTYVAENEIIYFKDQESRHDGAPQTFVKFYDGSFLLIEGCHADEIAQVRSEEVAGE